MKRNIVDHIMARVDKNNSQEIERELMSYLSENHDPSLLNLEAKNDSRTLKEYAILNRWEDLLCLIVTKYPEVSSYQDKHGNTMLHDCASHGLSTPLIKALETDENYALVKNKAGMTFLHIAGVNGLKRVITKAHEVDPMLLAIKDHNGHTALSLAYKFNVSYAPDTIKDLLDRRREEISAKREEF